MQTKLVRNLFGEVNISRPVKIVAAHSSKLACVAGNGWLAVGDAGQSYDPLSGGGIDKAITSGLATAEVINSFRAGDSTAMNRFAAGANLDFRHYMIQRQEYYARENRWTNSVFWQRRKF